MLTLDERINLLEEAREDTELQAILLEKCREDILFWFNAFCVTFNPRQKPYTFPFVLYPFQKQIVREIRHCIDTGEPLLFKKSRDMGATWLILLAFQWYWLFEEGSDFYCTSKTQNDVDLKGSKSTLFEKLRFNLSYLPNWMAPTLGKNHDAFCRMINPKNGNSITGGAAVVDLGRSQRYKAALLDEFARLPYGEASYDSISQSTDCIIMAYTPYGKSNKAYKLFKSPDIVRVPLTYEDAPGDTESETLYA